MKKIKKFMKRKTKVYSLEYGAGEVVGMLKLYDGIEDYIEVEFTSRDGEVKVFPNRLENDLRIISNPVELEFVLKSLHNKIMHTDYSEVVSSYQRIGVDMDLDILITIIARLVGRIDLRPTDKNLLAQCIDSLVLEVGHVFKINESRAKGIVSDYMRAA
jgi:RNA polymerase-interacting CarD/CdnL/TRCF family regulator